MYGGLSAESYLALQENMINRRPAVFGLSPADGWGGHAIVCDGYNTDGEYHLNFGWGVSAPQKMTEVWYRLPSDLYPLDLVDFGGRAEPPAAGSCAHERSGVPEFLRRPGAGVGPAVAADSEPGGRRAGEFDHVLRRASSSAWPTSSPSRSRRSR